MNLLYWWLLGRGRRLHKCIEYPLTPAQVVPGQEMVNGGTSWKLTNLIRGGKLDVGGDKMSDQGTSSQPSSGPNSAAPSPARSRKGGGINLLPEVVSC